MEKKIIFDLHNFEGKYGSIEINHMLYGNQKIVGIIHIIDEENRTGVRIKNQDIFLWRNEVIEVNLSEHTCVIAGKLMQIKIKIE